MGDSLSILTIMFFLHDAVILLSFHLRTFHNRMLLLFPLLRRLRHGYIPKDRISTLRANDMDSCGYYQYSLLLETLMPSD